MGAPRPQATLGDELANLGVALLIGAAVLAVLMRGAGTVAAWVTGAALPAGGPETGLTVFFNPGNPSDALHAPGLHAIAYWLTVIVLLGCSGAAGIWLWRVLRDTGRKTMVDPYRIPGIATRTDVLRAASQKALLRRAAHLRPSLGNAKPSDIGYPIGRSRGTTIWASVEDSILVIGPPRSGKGAHIIINAILDSPGPVVTTSTRPDNLTATFRTRQQAGPVAVFDPQQLAPGVPAGVRWSPIRGCENPLTAMIRAAGLAAGTGLAAGGVDGGGFWEAKTRTALQALLHAAALDHRPPAELFRWTLDPATAHDAVSILLSSPTAATGWGDSLQGLNLARCLPVIGRTGRPPRAGCRLTRRGRTVRPRGVSTQQGHAISARYRSWLK
jgi:type IV secretion system protein VirD4